MIFDTILSMSGTVAHLTTFFLKQTLSKITPYLLYSALYLPSAILFESPNLMWSLCTIWCSQKIPQWNEQRSVCGIYTMQCVAFYTKITVACHLSKAKWQVMNEWTSEWFQTQPESHRKDLSQLQWCFELSL